MNSDPRQSKLDGSFGRHAVSPHERKQRIRDVFNRVASRYDLMNDLMSFGIHRLWKRRFVAGLPERGLFVDLAGGTGDVAALLARRNDRRVVVLDPSIPMMCQGRGRKDAAGVEWLAGEAERLPFPDASVDVLTVSFGLRNTTRLDVAVAEVVRVLKPGGTFACLEFSRPVKWFQVLYDPYSFHVIPRLGAWVADNPAAYEYLVESIRNFPDQERFAAMLQGAGLSSVSWRNLSLGIACIHQGRKPPAWTEQGPSRAT
jgi:demethylmenaquinone methyltransferase/2-methoxy-6-polyprenyl-1,4-benzoquinol methylase